MNVDRKYHEMGGIPAINYYTFLVFIQLSDRVKELEEALAAYHSVFPNLGVVDSYEGLVWHEDADNLMEYEDLVRVGENAAALLTPAKEPV